MTGYKNLFTRKDVPAILSHLTYDRDVSLTSADSIYFAVRSANELKEQPLAGSGFEHLNDISDAHYAFVDRPVIDNHLELNFMRAMSLVVEREEGYYISPHAKLLYDSDGLFKTNSTAKFHELLRLCTSYILPGRYWAAFYAKQWLSNTIRLPNALTTEMTEIEREWDQIKSLIPL